jgi:glycosyltransferase involved in cell wall biosynthesis
VLLADALGDLDGPERYVILRGRRGGHIAPRSVERICLTPPHHVLERWTLPIDIMTRQPWPSLLHSVDHVAPAWGPWRSVLTLHDLAFLLYPETHTEASRAYYAASGESARRAQRVIAVSQRTASDAVRLLGVDPARVRVVHEAASPAFFPRAADDLAPIAARLGFDAARRFLLFIGTLEPRKNVPLLLDAFSIVRRQVDVQLVLVGARGWLDAPIVSAHARSGVGDAARFVGWVDEADLAVLYSHAGAMVLPSLYEGFGLPVLEAMACGAPVICSNAGPLPEVAGDAAVMLPPSDPSAWASAILGVLTSPARHEELRARGFARAAAFSWKRTAEATRDVYREALLA